MKRTAMYSLILKAKRKVARTFIMATSADQTHAATSKSAMDPIVQSNKDSQQFPVPDRRIAIICEEASQ